MLILALVAPGLAAPAAADRLRLATWNVELTRRGPGLLLRDIRGGEDAQVAAVVAGIAALDADVLLLTNLDWDGGLAALTALQAALAAAGAPYPHRLAPRPNTGRATGIDLDGDGRRGGPADAQGWGRFAGEGGMALLSRLPLDTAGLRDHTALLWRDLPGAAPPLTAEALAVQRLSSTGHWEVPVILPGGGRLTVLAFHATPPAFDGPGDRNGARNAAEIGFWALRLSGSLGPPPDRPVVMGTTNLDPADGDGRRGAIRALLGHPVLQDPAPRGAHGRADPGQAGDPALDTALFAPPLDGLRVEVVLPAASLRVTAAGVLWPAPGDPLGAVLAAVGRHRPVWVDVALP